jgi:predicted phage terminase large subunit-like protein
MNSILSQHQQKKDLIEYELLYREAARNNYLDFVTYTMPAYNTTRMHIEYANILNLFAQGKIKKLIITMPPQHGKSELSTRKLPAFMFGKNPNLNIGIASYNQTFARKFSVQIQRNINNQLYHNLFPDTTLARTKFTPDTDNVYSKTKDEFEIVNHLGLLKAVGRGGTLTGNLIDLMLMDDIYKDYAEGSSPIIRENSIDWYTSVVRTRLHNDSQQLIVFTRWDEEDLIGFIESKETVILLTKRSQLENINPDHWYKINFAALSTPESVLNEFDFRKREERPLWHGRHSKKKLVEDRQLDENKFESLHQGDPKPKKGLLYSNGFNMYTNIPNVKGRFNYTDVADKGTDYLCSICYLLGVDDYRYVIDIIYTQDGQTITEPLVADMLVRNNIKECWMESNNGGGAFARNVDRLSNYKLLINTFHQSKNKESRINTESSTVERKILMPPNWTTKWPRFAKDVKRFKKNFKTNAHDDAADTLTGCIEYPDGAGDVNDALYRS